MSLPDGTAIAALSAQTVKPVFYAFLDIAGGTVRCNTSGANVTPSGTGDSNLDGHEFIGINADFIDIAPVRYATGGSESVIAKLSGIPDLDDVSLALIADPAKWRGRNAFLWRVIRNASNVQQGGFHNYYTGKMTAISHSGDVRGQAIAVTIESYLAVFSQASNRTYMDQERFDSGDLSAQAAIAIANGNFSGGVVPQTIDPSQYGGPWGGFGF
jgi:hypothetical protein